MILVGNPRGGARDLARHLMKQENERVEVAELRGFMSDNLDDAFKETYAISRGTKCKQFLFSLSLSPPKEAIVSEDQFFAAIDRVESGLGLTNQPRAVVFHEKRGDDGQLRKHAHAVWSRIDVQEMKAVVLYKSHEKMQSVSRELYLEHGWKMPRGLAVSGDRDPRNFSLAEWQQAKRIGKDPREMKTAFQDAWAISDSKVAFTHALQERGYWLCRGDKKGYVALDVHGEVQNIAKRVGIKTKDVRERLGDIEALPSLADTKQEIARDMQRKINEFKREVAEKERREREDAARKRVALKIQQKQERAKLAQAQRDREKREQDERQARLRKGFLGLWDRIRGERKRTAERNEKEAVVAKLRDQTQRQTMASTQVNQRKAVTQERTQQRQENKATVKNLTQDAQVFKKMETDAERDREARKEAFKQKRRTPTQDRPRRRSRSRDGPNHSL